MEPLYSLEYFDRIFGCRGPEFWELIEALEAQLESYAADLPTVLVSRKPGALADLRHSHSPMVENLRLNELRALEREIRDALENRVPDNCLSDLSAKFGAHARLVVQALASERCSR